MKAKEMAKVSKPKWKKQVEFLESYKDRLPGVKDEIKRVERRQEKHRKKNKKNAVERKQV